LRSSQSDQQEVFITDQYVPALRQRFLEDMQIKGLQPKTQTMYLHGMRDFTRFLGRSPDTATPEDLRAFQLDMKERGVGAPTFNTRLTVLSFWCCQRKTLFSRAGR
jgi:integrase/recombinase XerD